MKIKKFVYDVIILFLGVLISAASINIFYIPFKFLTGGVTGIAILIEILIKFPSSISVLIFNIPLIILGYFFVSKRFTLLTLVGLIFFSFCLYITKDLRLNINIFSAIVLGGIAHGFGNFLIFKSEGSGGGTDIIGKIFNILFGINIASVIFIFDIFSIGMSSYFFGIDISMYTLVNIYISTVITNYFIEGIYRKKTIFIISEKSEKIAEKIMKRLNRGTTIIKAFGGYTKKEKNILFCTIGIYQINKLKDIVRNIDENAFITIYETAEVFGEGFLKIKK